MKTPFRYSPGLVAWLLFVLAVAAGMAWRYTIHIKPDRSFAGGVISWPVYEAWVVGVIGLVITPAQFRRDGRWLGWLAIDGGLCNTLIANVILKQIPLRRPSGGMHGFPSGHTMFACVLAWLFYRFSPRWGWIGFPIAMAVGWGRVAIQDHYPYQVYAGAVLGLALGYAVITVPGGLLLPRLIDRFSSRSRRSSPDPHA